MNQSQAQYDDVQQIQQSKAGESYMQPAGQTLVDLYGQAGTDTPLTETQKGADLEKQSAYISYQKLMKYLNVSNAAQSSPLSASDQIKAHTAYQNQISDIDSRNVEEDADPAKQEYWSSMIRDTIDTKLSNMDVDEETGELTAESWQSLWKIYEGNKGKMNQDQQEIMEFYLNNIDHEGGVAGTELGNESIVGKKFGKYTVNNVEGKQKVTDTSKYEDGQIINEANAANQQVYVYYQGYLYPVSGK